MNEVISAMVERRSCRKFLSKPVPEELLEQVLLAGSYAPSGMGKQSARVIALTKQADIAELERINAAVLGNPDARPFYGAPVVLVVLADKGIMTAVEDGSLVMGNLLLAAHSLGLGACWIHRAKEEFEMPEGRELLKRWGISGDYIGVGHCILGYRDGTANAAAPRKQDAFVKI